MLASPVQSAPPAWARFCRCASACARSCVPQAEVMRPRCARQAAVPGPQAPHPRGINARLLPLVPAVAGGALPAGLGAAQVGSRRACRGGLLASGLERSRRREREAWRSSVCAAARAAGAVVTLPSF